MNRKHNETCVSVHARGNIFNNRAQSSLSTQFMQIKFVVITHFNV